MFHFHVDASAIAVAAVFVQPGERNLAASFFFIADSSDVGSQLFVSGEFQSNLMQTSQYEFPCLLLISFIATHCRKSKAS